MTRNYLMTVTDTVAPESCSVLDIAQVTKSYLIAAQLYRQGCNAHRPHDWLEGQGEAITDGIYEYLYNEAYDSFKSWANDLNRFYNATKAREILRDLFDAALTIGFMANKDEINWRIAQLNDGNPNPMLNHWRIQHGADPISKEDCVVGAGLDYVTSPPQ